MGQGIFGLLGRRLGHSYSVPIHAAFGTPSYRLIELEPEELKGFLKKPDIRGLNVTIPYKREVMHYLDEISDTALEIGSVNTVVRREDGALIGDNTDEYGLRWMAGRAGIDMAGRKVVIFGSGGASLTAQYAARQAGAAQVVVVSRSGEDNYENLYRHYDAHVLINATPVGMYPEVGRCVADPALFRSCEGVLDLIFNPRRTEFILRAEELGIRCEDGLSMLVAQAKAAEELFYGSSIDDGEIDRVFAMLRRDVQNLVLMGTDCEAVGTELAGLTGRALWDARMGGDELAAAGRNSGRIILAGTDALTVREEYKSLRQNGRIYRLFGDGEVISGSAQAGDFKPAVVEVMSIGASARRKAKAVWREYLEHFDR